mmetsp:Transcript_100956/g.324075  ORF Transcript_100956/g.324075 Transcript_100956/m.324075 type:complete len:248 (-) Transcript_100956:1505-2248(-)
MRKLPNAAEVLCRSVDSMMGARSYLPKASASNQIGSKICTETFAGGGVRSGQRTQGISACRRTRKFSPQQWSAEPKSFLQRAGEAPRPVPCPSNALDNQPTSPPPSFRPSQCWTSMYAWSARKVPSNVSTRPADGAARVAFAASLRAGGDGGAAQAPAGVAQRPLGQTQAPPLQSARRQDLHQSKQGAPVSELHWATPSADSSEATLTKLRMHVPLASAQVPAGQRHSPSTQSAFSRPMKPCAKQGR